MHGPGSHSGEGVSVFLRRLLREQIGTCLFCTSSWEIEASNFWYSKFREIVLLNTFEFLKTAVEAAKPAASDLGVSPGVCSAASKLWCESGHLSEGSQLCLPLPSAAAEESGFTALCLGLHKGLHPMIKNSRYLKINMNDPMTMT